MIRSTVSTCLCRQRGQRIVDVDQLFGELVKIEPALGVAIDLKPGGGDGFDRPIAEVEPGPLQRSVATPRAGSVARAPLRAAARSALPSS